MAFPTVVTRGLTDVDTGIDPIPIVMPSGIVAGNRLLSAVTYSNDGVPSWSADWVQTPLLSLDFGSDRLLVVWKEAAGGDSLTIDSAGGPAALSGVTWRITGHGAGIAPELASAMATSTNPNPPSLAPTWGARDTLWIVVSGRTNGTVDTAAPTNYINFQQIASTLVSQCAAERQLNAASEDPGVFTNANSAAWATATIAISPAGGGDLPSNVNRRKRMPLLVR